MGLEVTHPTIRGEKNYHLDDPDLFSHYRRSLFISFLDCSISELKQRFEICQNLLSHPGILVPSKTVSVDPKTMKLESLLEPYGDILPELWCNKWETVLITE
jgi:hypothetical protein